MTLYLVKMRVSMLGFMGTAAWFFFVINVIKVPIVLSLGLLTWQTLLAGACFLPALGLGAAVGVFVFRRMDPAVFTDVALLLSGAVAVWPIIHG